VGEVLFEQFADAIVVIHQQKMGRAIQSVEGGRGIHMRRPRQTRRLQEEVQPHLELVLRSEILASQLVR
jgi:hypothetical protein